MNSRNKLIVLLGLIIILSAGIGIFYTNGGEPRDVMNIYGQKVILYGDGIYANNSILKVGTAKGTDAAAILFAIFMIVFAVKEKAHRKYRLCKMGLLSVLLYNSTCVAMGITFNRLFLLYLVQFSLALFLFLFEVFAILKEDFYQKDFYEKSWKGTAIFLIIGGCSVLIWLMYILPAVSTGAPMEIIEVYTTEPTFVIDLGIILPSSFMCGIAILKQKKSGFHMAPVLLTLITCVGIVVIFQKIAQKMMGLTLSVGQMLGLVISFVILGTIAIRLNYKMLKCVTK